MDDGGRAMEGPSAADAARSSAALPSGLCWRTDPDRRLAALVVRDARAAMHAARLHRRCDEPADASAVCGDGVDVRFVMYANNYDPIERGYARNLRSPGGNVTGVFTRQPELAEKQVELLTQAFPS